MGSARGPSIDSSASEGLRQFRIHHRTNPALGSPDSILANRHRLENRKAPTHLLRRDRVLHEHQVRQLRERAQRVQVRQLRHLVLGQNERGQVGDRAREGRRDAGDAVAGQQQRLQPRAEGEVGDGGDVIVGEVDGVLVLVRQRPRVSPARSKRCGVLTLPEMRRV